MFLFLVLILLLIFCFLYIKEIKYLKDTDAPFEMPLPFFGNGIKSAIRMQSFAYVLDNLYKKFSDSRYFVFLSFQQRVIVVKDPELIKMVTIKEFDSFSSHEAFIAEGVDPLWEKNLLIIRDPERWRRMRATLSPFFTSSKMRFIFKLMNDCAANFTEHYLEKKQTFLKTNIKDAFERYGIDSIASTAFGVTCNSLKDKNNEFYLMGKNVANVEEYAGWKLLVYSVSPFLAKVLRISIINKKEGSFFRRLVKENIRSRENNGIVRPDMIHLLMEARRNLNKQEVSDTTEDVGFAVVEESEMIKKETQKQELTDEDITAQAVIFLIGGFDMISILMGFTALELAANPDIQNRLAEEISDLYRIKGNSPSYEDVLHLTYLDMVITESLRKWPPAVFTDRVSTKPYTLKPPREGGKPLFVPKGSPLWIPIYSIHRDEKYYPNADVFDPERFSQENKANIKPYTFLPFGMGPRNCIGSRYALMGVKIIFYHLLVHFEIVPVEETKLPLKLGKSTFLTTPDGGFTLGLKVRSE